MTRTCGRRSSRAFARSASRCSTPNLCCSSTTTRPRSANCTLSSSSACVPMTMPAAPEAASSIAFRRAACDSDPVSNVTVVAFSAPPSWPPSARSPSMSVIERRCCCASTSVGASNAAWPPASMTASIARSAMTVLPEPTSPCNRRCIGWSAAISEAISSPMLRCPFGEFERQSRIEGGKQPVIDRAPRGGRQSSGGRPALGEHDLQDERLVPREPGAGRSRSANVFGRWIPSSASRYPMSPSSSRIPAAPDLRAGRRPRARSAHAAPNDDRGGVLRRRDTPPGSRPRSRSHRRSSSLLERLDLGVHQLQLAVEDVDLAGEEGPPHLL